MTELKTCSKCGVAKPIECFSLRYGEPRSGCKECASIARKRYYSTHRAEALRYHKENYNPEERRMYNAQYYSDKREDCLKSSKRWKFRNKERISIYNRKYHIINWERIRIDPRRKMSARRGASKYRKLHPERVTASRQNNRAMRAKAEGTHTPQDIKRQFKKQEGKCYYCGCELSKRGRNKYHVDHLMPLSKGGTNGPENLVCACPTCNFSKNAKLPWEFAPDAFIP